MDWDAFFAALFSYPTLGLGFLTALSAKFLQDLAWYRYDMPTRDQADITKECYDLFEHFLPNTAGESIDYSEGLFDFENNSCITLQEATLNKYEYIFKQLGLKKDMTVLDAGCGDGVWMDFCRERGVKITGLTLSPEQANAVKQKGMNAEVWDYRIKREDYLGNFDRITVLGSTEHMCSSMGTLQYEDNESVAHKRSVETLSSVWSLLKSYLKPDGKIFVSTLTVNPNATWSVRDYLQAYILDQHYGGFYPEWSNIINAASNAGLWVTNSEDKTRDYHWSSMIEQKHFGYFTINWQENTWDKITSLAKNAMTSPFRFPFHCLYHCLDTWMWQFGGPQDNPLTEEQVKKAPAQLKYFMMIPKTSEENFASQIDFKSSQQNATTSKCKQPNSVVPNTNGFFKMKTPKCLVHGDVPVEKQNANKPQPFRKN